MNFNYNINSNLNDYNNKDEEMEDVNQAITPIPLEIWNTIFSYVDDYTLSNVTRVCREWYYICHAPFFDGWAFLYRALWKEGIPPTDALHTPFTHFTFRYRAVGFSSVTDWTNKRISISDNLLEIRHSKPYLHFISNCLNSPSNGSSVQLNDLSSNQQLSQWIDNIDILLKNGRTAEAYYLIQEIVHIHYDNNQLNKLQQIRSQILTYCLDENIEDSKRETNYIIFQSLFSPFAPISDFLKGLPEPWPVIYGAALYDFNFLMNGFLHGQHPDVYDEGPLLLQTAAESKSFAVLDTLLAHPPLLTCLKGTEPKEEFPLHALCTIDEQMMDEAELAQWMNFVTILIERGCSLMERNQEGETPYSIAARNFNPSMLQYLFNNTNANQANELNLQSILTAFIESLDEHSNEFDEKDYIRCRLTLEVLLSRRPSLKGHIQLSSLLFWHLPLFDSLVKFVNSEEQAFISRLIKTLLNLPKLHINHLIVNYQYEEKFIYESLEETLNVILQNMCSIIPYIDHNRVDEQGRTILHLLIVALRNVEKSLEDADDPIQKESIFRLCLTHYSTLISQLVNNNNCLICNEKGKTAFEIARHYKYSALLPLLNPTK